VSAFHAAPDLLAHELSSWLRLSRSYALVLLPVFSGCQLGLSSQHAKRVRLLLRITNIEAFATRYNRANNDIRMDDSRHPLWQALQCWRYLL
jgi:hypothetical protein